MIEEAPSPRHVTRKEFVALVISRRPLVRIVRDEEQVHELIDMSTNEHFVIRQQDLLIPSEQ